METKFESITMSQFTTKLIRRLQIPIPKMVEMQGKDKYHKKLLANGKRKNSFEAISQTSLCYVEYIHVSCITNGFIVTKAFLY